MEESRREIGGGVVGEEVNERQMQTTEEKVDTRNDAHADDADIKPIYDEEPMAEVEIPTGKIFRVCNNQVLFQSIERKESGHRTKDNGDILGITVNGIA
ncbi:hypothetical protein Tco_0738837 [Tanacetum coccineum]